MDLKFEAFNVNSEEISPLQAIKRKCLYDCGAGNTTEYRECPNKSCWLYPFRLGHNPYRKKREYTEEQLNSLREQIKNIRNN